jgi:hypothetical protein
MLQAASERLQSFILLCDCVMQPAADVGVAITASPAKGLLGSGFAVTVRM